MVIRTASQHFKVMMNILLFSIFRKIFKNVHYNQIMTFPQDALPNTHKLSSYLSSSSCDILWARYTNGSTYLYTCLCEKKLIIIKHLTCIRILPDLYPLSI